MASPVAVALLTGLLAVGQGAVPISTADQIDQMVEQLGSPRFEERQRASELLWQAGEAAEPALIKAARSDDPEVVVRARRILRSFQYGIYPGTPPEIVQRILRFQRGSESQRRAVLRELMHMGEMTVLLRLVKILPNEAIRQQCTLGLVKDLDRVSGQFFLSNEQAKVEELLELGAITEKGMRNFTTFLLLRGKLEDKVAELRDRLTGVPNPVDTQLLAHLLRAKGDLAAAKAVAAKTNSPDLIDGILFEMGDWKELARRQDEGTDNPRGTSTGGIVYLGYSAAYHRLAGNVAQQQKAIDGIKKLAAAKPNKLKYCGEALVINNRVAEAIELFGERDSVTPLDILARQGRFREALRLAGIDDPQGPFLPWLEPVPEDKTEPTLMPSAEQRNRFYLGLKVAATLCRLGEDELAGAIFDELATTAKQDRQLSLRAVCEAEAAVGMTGRSLRDAAASLANERSPVVLQIVFPKHGGITTVWWEHFLRKYPAESPRETLDRLDLFLSSLSARPGANGQDEEAPWVATVREAADAPTKPQPSDRAAHFTAMAETCLAGGNRDLAREYLRRAVEAVPEAETMLRLGDLAVAEDSWPRAAEWFRKASQADSTSPIALFLCGYAMTQTGQEPEGSRLIEAARLVPLGNAEARATFAEQLQRRGLHDEAARQWELVLRTGEMRSGPVSLAAEQLGNAVAEKNPLKAAGYWQWILLRSLRTSSAKIGIQGFLERIYQIHKVRARGLLAAGKVDEALKQIERARIALPSDISLACEMIPLLEKAGQSQAADSLYTKILAANRRVLDDFPKSRMHQDNLAELAARCGR